MLLNRANMNGLATDIDKQNKYPEETIKKTISDISFTANSSIVFTCFTPDA